MSLAPKHILITGGSGYIGKISQYYFHNRGYPTFNIDNNSAGTKPLFLARYQDISVCDIEKLHHLFRQYKFDVVIHLAGAISVQESIDKPHIYETNNVIGSQNLLEAMRGHCDKIIFASTASVYGNTNYPVSEEDNVSPNSPYGLSKLRVEKALQQAVTHGISSIAFRLFNVCGALISKQSIENSKTQYSLGKESLPAFHIIPTMLQKLMHQEAFEVFGTEHNTHDGTCVRDYIHVLDVIKALEMGINFLNQQHSIAPAHHCFNIGSGIGLSVLDIIQSVERVTQHTIAYKIQPPRIGDINFSVANIQKVKETLGWAPTYSSIQNILKDCWQHQQLYYQRYSEQNPLV